MSVENENNNWSPVAGYANSSDKERAGRINAMRGLSSSRDEAQKQPDKREELVRKAVRKTVPNATLEQSETITQDLLSKKSGVKIKSGNEEFLIDDFSCMVAQSMESLNSETNSEQEYSRWIDDASSIVKEMNDGFVSADDMKHREEFIGDMTERETEIKTCISLYRNSNTPQAKERLAFLEKKLAKLMELRSLIKSSTKDRADAIANPIITPEEHEKAKIYLRVLHAWKNDIEVPDRIKMKLGISQGLLFDYSVSEELLKHRSDPQSKEEAIDRINALRGRSSILFKDRVQSPVRQKFDAERFNMLKKMQEEMRTR